MISRNEVLFLLFSFIASTLFSFHVCNSADGPLAASCPLDTFYDNSTADGRTFRNNLDSVLSTLVSNASQPNGFYNYTAGTGQTAVYGLFLCRGNVSSSDCQDCLTTAWTGALSLCPDKNQVTIWYDKCMLRYSDQPIFSRLDESNSWLLPNPNTVTDTSLLSQVLNDTFDQIVTQAKNGAGKKFAVREANFTSAQRIYAMGQCTPDLSSSDCERCLKDATGRLPQCCSNRQGGGVLFPSCNIRYEEYEFYNQVPAPPPAPEPPTSNPPPSLGPNTTTTSSNAQYLNNSKRSNVKKYITIVVPSIAGFLLLVLAVGLALRKLKGQRQKDRNLLSFHFDPASSYGVPPGKDNKIDEKVERYVFDLRTITSATNSFAISNKLGEGGFGSVFKGQLQNGREIAVKRLSRSSGQGIEEFKNETTLIARLQHRNLVKLLGCCIQQEEKMLVYEYLPNKGLDNFIFDKKKGAMLDWRKRFEIIIGIARGIVYLHRDSRLRIIHRDLKASNVLLDANMEPKISDFGMARIFGADQLEAKTHRVVGTYGYMSPEYAMQGLFSEKSDVFSYGVLLLEIISGRKSCSYLSENTVNLIAYAWRLWKEGKAPDLVDPALGELYDNDEAVKCIQIGLLCVQEHAMDRPTMSAVLSMLCNETSISLASPKEPAFVVERLSDQSHNPPSSSSASLGASANDVTITVIQAR